MSGIRNLKKGDILFREGDVSDAMFVIKAGRIAVLKAKGSSEIQLAELSAGDMLGEMAFFDNKPRSASARASTEAIVIELPFKALNAQFKTFPEWLKAVVSTVNRHLRNANQKIKNLERSEEETAVFPPHTITRLMGVLAMVASHYGTKTDEGISVPSSVLRRYTIQVFQQSTAKMQTLMETLMSMKYMNYEESGEGRQKIVIFNLALFFEFVEFYNNYLFKDEAKRITVDEKELLPLKALLHYGANVELDAKGLSQVNLTRIEGLCKAELGFPFNSDEVNSLSEKGLVAERMSDGAGNVILSFEHKKLKAIHPHWEIIYALKKHKKED